MMHIKFMIVLQIDKNMHDIQEAVHLFVSEAVGYERSLIKDSTLLRADMGLDGDDAYEFMRLFSEHFAVDMSKFEFDKHFGGEASYFPLLSNWISSNKKDIDVGALVRIAHERRWCL
jgi:hypothetical protein